jgi:Fe-S cluster assembly protein SufB
VPVTDNYFAALNSAVFSDGSFVYIPKGVRCPMELSTYFRINAANTGQFERTLIIADEGAYVSYLEGCTAPMRDENQLHAAVVELVALDDARSSTRRCRTGTRATRTARRHLQLRHQARRLPRAQLEDLLDAGRDRLGDHLEVPELHPARATNSVGEFYSVALTNNYQQADTGTKMIHIGRNTRSTIVSKGISAGRGQNTYRGLVKIAAQAPTARATTPSATRC